MQTPSIGRIIHYFPTAEQVAEINAARNSGSKHCNQIAVDKPLAAVITAAWFTPSEYRPGVSTINAKAWLDGEGEIWALSIHEGSGPGCWSWPPFMPASKPDGASTQEQKQAQS